MTAETQETNSSDNRGTRLAAAGAEANALHEDRHVADAGKQEADGKRRLEDAATADGRQQRVGNLAGAAGDDNLHGSLRVGQGGEVGAGGCGGGGTTQVWWFGAAAGRHLGHFR